MHWAAYHFIKALRVPLQMTTKRKLSWKGAKDDEAGNEDEDDKNNEKNNEVEGENENEVEVEVEDDVDVSMDVDASAEDAEAMAETLLVGFEPGDTIGKLLTFVNQVQISSEDVCEYLAQSCCLYSIKPIELRLWVHSRWGSLSQCLATTLEVQKVCLC